MMRGLVIAGLLVLLLGCGNESAAPPPTGLPAGQVITKSLTKTGAAVDGTYRTPPPVPTKEIQLPPPPPPPREPNRGDSRGGATGQ